jgi:hypothetical protein
MGIRIPLQDLPVSVNENDQLKRAICEPVPINKVGDYCEGDDGNTTSPVEFNNVQSLAILDSGAGVATSTKQIWDSWGQPALRKTRMKLQLADGYVKRPMGLLEKVVVLSCNIEYEHTFAVVEFGTKPNYKIILGRPFMRQLKMIQDWGYSYLFLRQPNATTRIDLKSHSFCDVQNTSVRDFETSTMEDTTPSWLENGKPLWLCGLDKNGSERKSEINSYDYIAEPFPEHKIEPFGWQEILATLDVCAVRFMPHVIVTMRATTLDH